MGILPITTKSYPIAPGGMHGGHCFAALVSASQRSLSAGGLGVVVLVALSTH